MAQEEQLMRVGEVGVCMGVQQVNIRWNECWTMRNETWNEMRIDHHEIE